MQQQAELLLPPPSKRPKLPTNWNYAQRDELYQRIIALGDKHMRDVMHIVFGSEMHFSVGDELDVDFEKLDEGICDKLDKLVRLKTAENMNQVESAAKIVNETKTIQEKKEETKKDSQAKKKVPKYNQKVIIKNPNTQRISPAPTAPPISRVLNKTSFFARRESLAVKSPPEPAKKILQEKKLIEIVVAAKIGKLPTRIELQRGVTTDLFRKCSVLCRHGRKYLLLFDDDLSLEWFDIGSKTTTWREPSKLLSREENNFGPMIKAEQCDAIMKWLCALDAANQVLRYIDKDGSSPLTECCSRLQNRESYGGIEFAYNIRMKVYATIINGLRRHDSTVPGWEEATYSLALGAPMSPSSKRHNYLVDEAVAITLGAQVLISCFEYKWLQLISSMNSKEYVPSENIASWRRPYSHISTIPIEKSCVGLRIQVWSKQAWRPAKIKHHVPDMLTITYEDNHQDEEIRRCNAIIRRHDLHRSAYFGFAAQKKLPRTFDANAYFDYLAQLATEIHTSKYDDDLPSYFSKQPPRRCRERHENVTSSSTTPNDTHLTENNTPTHIPTRSLVCHRLGKLVWAKSGSHPWWPGELAIIDKEALFEAMPPTAPKLQRRLIVLYFGETQYDLFTPGIAKTITDFDPKNPQEKLSIQNNDLDFALGLAHKRAVDLGLVSPF
uniref:PWWP domain-containing protein n=1 Tax=Aureoumbra lagunensis TaxID=44058 RepID=A0A7S3JTR2_9STRA|mmetsp:Transcript_5082/g.7603  ORF Transcript_5082/g.7603 Transcript_5082/m.7603 type:complete len:667 (-) Transcript_5082:261-2261(-)